MDDTVSTNAGRFGDTLTQFRGAVVILGVTGSISAYKAVELCRRLMDGGAYVVPILTRSATEFIGAATFSALASESAKTELFGDIDPIPHTRLGRMADVVLVAPATATIIGEYAHGIGADLLSATLLCTNASVVVCPAMHAEMWENEAVRENVATLRRRGVTIVEPESGRLAGGDVGTGRLASPEAILETVAAVFARSRELAGVSILVTAGGTREPLDPVRFISNRSSGKQGYAIATAAQQRGAAVTLVSTVDLPPPHGVNLEAVETAAEMEAAVNAHLSSADVVIMAAAVADFRPVDPAPSKWKKRDGVPQVVFAPTPDIIAGVAKRRRPDQIIVGFAAETADAEREGQRKLEEKGLDLVVVNDVSAPGVGFGYDTNAVTIFAKGGRRTEVTLAPKSTIAGAVLDEIIRQRDEAPGRQTPSHLIPELGAK